MQQQKQQSADNPNSNLRIVNNTIIFETDKPDAFRNSVVKFSAKLNSETVSDNEISVRWSSAPHYGDNIVQCFDVGFGIKTGKTRMRYEHKHPEYTDVLGVGETMGYPLTSDSYVELEFVKYDNEGERTPVFEVYQTRNNGERIKLFRFEDPAHYVEHYPNGCQIAIKPKENLDRIDIKDISVEEIFNLAI